MNKLSNIFNAEAQITAGGKNQLALTANLTQVSTVIANDIINRIDADDNAAAIVSNMYADYNALNHEIAIQLEAHPTDIEWLQEISTEDAIKMLKSQQSKRSRARSTTMTLTNFKTMLTAAVAEELLRRAHNITRSAGGSSRRTELVLTEEMVDAYTADQAKLAKAIRNVQSKKSIMKKKPDFDEASEEWMKLLEYEASLKALRTNSTAVDTQTIEKAKKADEFEQMLTDIDPTKMKKDELAAALEQMKSMMLSSIK